MNTLKTYLPGAIFIAGIVLYCIFVAAILYAAR